MLALVDREYKFRLVDMGTAGSCLGAQILNSSHLKAKIEDESIGFSNLCPITQDGPDVHHFILTVENVFGIMASRLKVLLTNMEQPPKQ